MADKAGVTGEGAGASVLRASADAFAGRLRQRAHRGARLRRAGDDGSLRAEPASPRLATRTRRSGWRPTTAYGSAATCGAISRRCGRTLRPSSATSRRVPIRPRPASPTAPLGSLIGSPESIARRESIWNARWPCSNPAATTIWPFASDTTLASPRWSPGDCSWPLGDVGRAVSLVEPPQARIAGLDHVGTRALRQNARGHVRAHARRPSRAAPNAFELARLAREHDLQLWSAFGVFLEGWARSQSGAPPAGSRTCAAAPSFCASRTFCCSTGS